MKMANSDLYFGIIQNKTLSYFIQIISLHYVNYNLRIYVTQKKDQCQLWKWINWLKVGLASSTPQVSSNLNAADWNKLLLSMDCMNKTIHLSE